MMPVNKVYFSDILSKNREQDDINSLQTITSCNFPEALKCNHKANIYLWNKTTECDIKVNEKYDTLAN